MLRVDKQGWFNNFSALYMIITTIIIIATILIASQTKSTGDFVWQQWNNDTGMDNKGYVCCLGLLMCLYSFSGYEGAAHMSEETKDASASAPRGIWLTCVVTAIKGFVYIVGMLYACQNKIEDIT